MKTAQTEGVFKFLSFVSPNQWGSFCAQYVRHISGKTAQTDGVFKFWRFASPNEWGSFCAQ